MADEPTTPAAPPDGEELSAEAKTVPYERFRETNESNKTLKQQLEDVSKKLREREEAEMSAVEREKARADRLEQEATKLKGELANTTRRSLIVDAARDAGFRDPADAAAFIDLSSVETETQAKRAVKDLAERKAHLLAEQRTPPELGRVLANGELTEEAKRASGRDAGAHMDQLIRERAGRG